MREPEQEGPHRRGEWFCLYLERYIKSRAYFRVCFCMCICGHAWCVSAGGKGDMLLEWHGIAQFTFIL